MLSGHVLITQEEKIKIIREKGYFRQERPISLEVDRYSAQKRITLSCRRYSNFIVNMKTPSFIERLWAFILDRLRKLPEIR